MKLISDLIPTGRRAPTVDGSGDSDQLLAKVPAVQEAEKGFGYSLDPVQDILFELDLTRLALMRFALGPPPWRNVARCANAQQQKHGRYPAEAIARRRAVFIPYTLASSDGQGACDAAELLSDERRKGG